MQLLCILKLSYSVLLEIVVFKLKNLPYLLFLYHQFFSVCIGGKDFFDFVLCSNKLSSHFDAPVFSLLVVFQDMAAVFSGLSCRCLPLKVCYNPPVTYVSYLFFLNCGHFTSKSVKKKFYSKKRLNVFRHTYWNLNNKISTEYPLLHYAAKIVSYLHM